MDHGQLKGIDDDTAQELCNIEFEDLAGDGRSKPIVLMAKKDYKAKFGKSCDFADTLCGLVEVARRKGFRLVPQGRTQERLQDADLDVRRSLEIYESVDYSDQPAEEVYEHLLGTS